ARMRRRHLHLVREGPERPPFVLRWVWWFAPPFVAAAFSGVFFAARSLRDAPPLGAALEAYAERAGQVYRVDDGARLRRGPTLRLVVAPNHARYVTISTSAGHLTRLGPLADETLRIDVPEPVVAEASGSLRISAAFDADRVVSLTLLVE